MPVVFGPRANLVAKVIAWLLLAAVVIFLLLVWLWPQTNYARHVGWPVEQNPPFSHEHHVAGLGIDCRYCHSFVEVSSSAGLPPTHTCMSCHSHIWTNADLLAPVRKSYAENVPLVWNRVTDVPDYVYFHHGVHIAKGVGCASCHGDVGRMPLTFKAKSLTMRFCLDCHRDPAPNLRPASAIYETEWSRTETTPSPESLSEAYHIGNRKLTECSICHR
jgi:hypothetical protein